MTNIDWTQPVETTETPPRPVRVLATDKRGGMPVVCLIPDHRGSEDHGYRATQDGVVADACTFALRNVAPKPEPVLREAWFALFENGTASRGFSNTSEIDAYYTPNSRVECRRIAWMSDGSPVPGEDKWVSSETIDAQIADNDAAWKRVHEEYVRQAQATIDLLRILNSELKTDVERITKDFNDLAEGTQQIVEKLEAERDQFRSIVALAHDWAFSGGTRVLRDPYELNLFDEVTMLGEDNRPQRKGDDAVNPELLKAIREKRLEKQLDRLRHEHEKTEARIAEFHDSLEWDELTAERDQWKQAAEQNMIDYQEMYRERDEARDAVKRLAGAITEACKFEMRLRSRDILDAVMCDRIVKHIVEGDR